MNVNYKAFLNNIGVGLVRCSNTGSAKMLFVNSFFCELFEITEPQAVKSSLNAFFKDKKQFQFLKKMLSFSESSLHNFEAELKGKKKEAFWCSISAAAVFDSKGKVQAYDLVIEDISLRKRSEIELKDSKDLFHTVFNNTAAAITVTDKNERIIAWNPFAESLLEMEKTDLFNKPVKDLYPKDEWKKIRGFKLRKDKKGIQQNIETQISTKTGRLIDVSISISILWDSKGEVVGAVGFIQDITEQKKAHAILVQSKQNAEAANSAKSMFLANMSHEVRTPMNTIMGMIDLTLDSPLSEEMTNNLKVAKDAGENLLNLLNDILDLSRVESGKITLEKIEFDLYHLVSNVCKGLSVIANEKAVEIVYQVQKEVPRFVEGDPVRVRQVLINLVNNAIKFTEKGKIEVDIVLNNDPTNPLANILFSVKDQGIGIPKDRQEKIFEVFTQADASTTRKFGGTGLGLAICKDLVVMMGGRIWVESDDGEGSTFYFSIHLETVFESQTDLTKLILSEYYKAKEENVDIYLKGLKILLAEDNVVNQKIAAKMLEKKGCVVVGAENGQAVLEALEKEHFDAVLMDAQMPIIDGFEATRRIRENEKITGKHIPIIALTGRAMQEDRQKCLDSGMDGYVIKPIDRKKLFEEIVNQTNQRMAL